MILSGSEMLQLQACWDYTVSSICWLIALYGTCLCSELQMLRLDANGHTPLVQCNIHVMLKLHHRHSSSTLSVSGSGESQVICIVANIRPNSIQRAWNDNRSSCTCCTNASTSSLQC